MEWTWSWWVFVPAIVVLSLLSMFSRGAMNAQNVRRYGAEADYNNNIGGAIVGCIGAGVVYAAIVTALVGFIL